MPDLPARPDLEQLRHQAKDLLTAAKNGDENAKRRIGAVSDGLTLSAAQLALAREYGFASWPRLKREVERRRILDGRDLVRLKALLAEEPELATAQMEHWCDHPRGASPLGYTAMLRYDTSHGVWRDVPDTGAVARILIEAGAPVDGEPGDRETPLITAASYGDAEIARALIEAGAYIEATSAPDSGGVPGGTALLHAAVFGMTDVVDVLVAAGAHVPDIEQAAAAGDVSGWIDNSTPDARVRALVFAADHQRIEVIDQLIAAETPVDAVDPEFGGHALRTAAGNGRPASVQRLLAHGADPNLRDPERNRTPLDWCRANRTGATDPRGYDEVEAILAPITSEHDSPRPVQMVGDRSTSQTDAPDSSRLTLVIRGNDLPGSRCGPSPEGQMYENVHIGLARRSETVELRRGDEAAVQWTFEVIVRRDDVGQIDFGGPFVHGRRGERSFGLRWGTLSWDDAFDVFRAAKLRVADIDPALVERALRENKSLVATLRLTDRNGHPVCASVRPPDVVWTTE